MRKLKPRVLLFHLGGQSMQFDIILIITIVSIFSPLPDIVAETEWNDNSGDESGEAHGTDVTVHSVEQSSVSYKRHHQ